MNRSTEWFREAQWGVFAHYLGGGTPEEWNARIDAFDIPALVEQIQRVNAGYFFLTIGQNTGFYCAPNPCYEDYVACGRNARCSRRDLPLELGEALRAHGIRLMLYINGVAPKEDETAARRLGCVARAYGDAVNGPLLNSDWWDWGLTPGFHERWVRVLQAWAARYGDLISGWWVDGCFPHVGFREEHVAAYKQALLTGNPSALCAFNGGVRTPLTAWYEADDYTAGEIESDFPVGRTRHSKQGVSFLKPGAVEGAQFHVLTYLGQGWGSHQPRFSSAWVQAYTAHLAQSGGVVTWDCGIHPNGCLAGDCLAQLESLKDIRGPLT